MSAVVLDVAAAPVATSGAVGAVLPLLVALVTRPRAEPTTRGVTLLLLSVATAVITELVARLATTDLGPTDWPSIVTGALVTWVTGQTAHAGVWRHTSLSARLRAVDPGRFGGTPRHRAPDPPTPHPRGRVARLQEVPPMALDFTDLLDQGERFTTNAATTLRSVLARAHQLASDGVEDVETFLAETFDKLEPLAAQLDVAFGDEDAPVPAGPLPADRTLDEREAAVAVGVDT